MMTKKKRPVLSGFQIIRPSYESKQEYASEWIAAAHAQSDQFSTKKRSKDDYYRLIQRVGCSPQVIGTRGHMVEDLLSTDWEKMRIFRLDKAPSGLGMEVRMAFYSEAVNTLFDRFYYEEKKAPQHLIHVTCTGYISPSGAQNLVANKGWGKETTVTHAYHMGCYGSLPAIRQAIGFLHASENDNVDIVHTELCSLHFNPASHTHEQFVVQSLFADGMIRYKVRDKSTTSGYEVLALREEILPNTADAMSWQISDWGMSMTLSKDVPKMIRDEVIGFISRLGEKASIDLSRELSKTYFGIHPGGPKILSYLEELLGIQPWQMQHSRAILFDYGNMSSATLPHIWERMLADDDVPNGALVISLAFGPGLTISGILLRKI